MFYINTTNANSNNTIVKWHKRLTFLNRTRRQTGVQEKLEEDWILGLLGLPIAIIEHLFSVHLTECRGNGFGILAGEHDSESSYDLSFHFRSSHFHSG